MSARPLPPLRWGVIGFGWVARDFVAPAICAAGDRLAAVFDPDAVAQGEAARRGARVAETADALCEGVDAVYVATPNHLHRAGVEAAARAGKPVLCEKPLAATLADAEAMVAAAERAGVLLGTAFDQRHHPAHLAVRDAVRAGRIGAVTAIRIVYACWLPRDWCSGGGAAADNWRIDPARAGGGALMDLAPHGLDLAGHLLDTRVERVLALTQRRVHDYAVDDGAVLVGALRGGALLQLHVAYNHPETLPRRRLELVGDRGMILAENTMGQDAGGRVRLFDETGAAHDLPVPDAERTPFHNQILAFGDAVRTGRREAFDARADLELMRRLDEAYRSAAGEAAR